ncbi:MAG: polysaccharide deacetylase family protein [Clostridia bacterium]|nr:polysaccharide deacetylase family protein [Clostridia bacterium]
MDKYLIINADDYGMCHSANLAVADLFQKGGITSSTIMTPCCWAKEAGKWVAEHPEYAVGVHLTFTSEWGNYRWSPIAQGDTSSLRDSEDFMYHESDEFEKNCDIDQVEKEIRAQIERFKSFGVTPSHIDNHMGSLYGIETGRFELLNLTLAIAGEYGLPFRFPGTFVPEMFANDTLAVKIDLDMIKMFYGKVLDFAKANGVAMPDFLIPGEWNGPQNDSYENFKEYIYELYKSFPNGVTETYIHPALESDELKGISGAWHRRVWEHKLFSDPQTLQHIKACGIQLINYRDLAEMKK